MRADSVAVSEATQGEDRASAIRTAILKWADVLPTWNVPWSSGIYPGEMVAFLGLCEAQGIRAVVESGRGEHGYSTQILGEYAACMGVQAVSIDLELDRARQACRTRIQTRYPHVRCLVGDAFELLPNAMEGLRGPVALLLDGPKLHPANRLSRAASWLFDVSVVAHHNCPLRTPWWTEFSACFPGAFHYEALGLSAVPAWQEFKRWEYQWVNGYELPTGLLPGVASRSLEASSLAMAALPSDGRANTWVFLWPRRPLRYHPLWLRWKWSRPQRARRA